MRWLAIWAGLLEGALRSSEWGTMRKLGAASWSPYVMQNFYLFIYWKEYIFYFIEHSYTAAFKSIYDVNSSMSYWDFSQLIFISFVSWSHFPGDLHANLMHFGIVASALCVLCCEVSEFSGISWNYGIVFASVEN